MGRSFVPSVVYCLFYLFQFLGHEVTQFVEELCCKPEGRAFDSRWCHWNFSLTQSFRPHYGPGVDSASNRNEYQEYSLVGKGGRCVGLTTLPPSCTDCLEIWEPRPPGNLRTLFIPILFICNLYYRGADKFLARPGSTQATATEDFEFHISYL